MDIINTLGQLSKAVGVAGSESAVAQLAVAQLKHFTDDVMIDALGNVVAVICPPKQGQTHVLLDAHLDEIGLIVTHIEDNGFVRVANCGGIDRRLLLAQQVTICGKQDVVGFVCAKPPHLESDEESKKVPQIDEIAIDTGFSKQQLEQKIACGDRVYLHTQYRQMLGRRVTGKALDDRAGMMSILLALSQLKQESFDCGLTVVFSVQEELGVRGASCAAYRTSPDIAIAVDVSFAYTNDAIEHKCGKMGKGAMIGVSPTLDRTISQQFIDLATAQSIPFQMEIMGGETGTNADAIGQAGVGVRTGLLSIPLRYMHTPVEMLDIADVESVANLLCAYVKTVK